MLNDVLSAKALNRATLARQLLLQRSNMSALDAVEHLVGMQAQAPDAPYIGLWTRLDEIQPGDLAALVNARRVVRTPLMRATVHLVSARDAMALRPLVQVVLERSFGVRQFARNLAGVDMTELLSAGAALIDEEPRTRAELGRLLAIRWPARDPASLAYAISYLLPAVQEPPRGIWGMRGPATLATMESWIDDAPDHGVTMDDFVVRYLCAFGPATVQDAQRWSGLSRLNEIIDRLRPQLRTFHDENGRELFDLPDAPRPDPETPAPPRYLPEYDNVLLAHADRSRFIPDRRPVPLPPGNGARYGTLLLDGQLRGTWEIVRRGDAAALHVKSDKLTAQHDEIAREGEQLLAYVAPAAGSRDVQFHAPRRLRARSDDVATAPVKC